jgi:uncharacterized membrane protein
MQTPFKIGVISALFWISIRLTFHFLGLFLSEPIPKVAVLLNILGLLTAISLGLFLHKKKETEESNALLDMKHAMSAGLPYVLLVGGFIYLYYGKINPECYQHQIAENDVAIERMVNNPKKLEQFKSQQVDAEVMTKDQIEKKLKENSRKGASAGFTATLSILAMLILSALYSMLTAIILRRFIFTKK